MKQLKQGTPVWYVLNGSPRLGYYLSTNNDRHLVDDPEHGMTVTPDCYAIQISEYIEHVMVTDGWERCKHRVEHIGHEIDISIDVSDISIWPQIQTHDMDGFASIIEEDVKLQQQALTHCEKLNLLKELEI